MMFLMVTTWKGFSFELLGRFKFEGLGHWLTDLIPLAHKFNLTERSGDRGFRFSHFISINMYNLTQYFWLWFSWKAFRSKWRLSDGQNLLISFFYGSILASPRFLGSYWRTFRSLVQLIVQVPGMDRKITEDILGWKRLKIK